MSQLARGDVAFAISLVVVLEVANAFAIPSWLAITIPADVDVPYGQLGRVLALALLAPLAIGAVLGARATLGAEWHRALRFISSVGLGLVIGIAIAQNGDAFPRHLDQRRRHGRVVDRDRRSGTRLGGRRSVAVPEDRRGTRHGGGGERAAIAIARASFPDQRSTIVAIVAFGLVSITVAAATALFVGHRSSVRALPESEEDG